MRTTFIIFYTNLKTGNSGNNVTKNAF